MGGRGFTARWGTAALAACPQRTLRRLLLAGAFCLVGWALLAGVDADTAAAGEHSAGGAVIGAARENVSAAERAAAGVEARPPARTHTGPEAALSRDRGQVRDGAPRAAEPENPALGAQHGGSSPDRDAQPLDQLPDPVDRVRDRTAQHAGEPGTQVGEPVRSLAQDLLAPATATAKRTGERLRPAVEAIPEPRQPMLPGHDLLPEAGSTQPTEPGGSPPAGNHSDVAPAAPSIPDSARWPARDLLAVPHDLRQPAADPSAALGDRDRSTPRPPALPGGGGLPPTPAGGSAPGTTGAGISGGSGVLAAPQLESVDTAHRHSVLCVVPTRAQLARPNDATEPPVSPD